MKPLLTSWLFWALLSAAFAALTAIFAKIGVANVNSDFATFLRTLVIIAVLAGMLTLLGEWQPLGAISRPDLRLPGALGAGDRRLVAVLFPRAAIGRRRARRACRQAQRRAGGGVRRRLPERAARPGQLDRRRADRPRGDAGGLARLRGLRRFIAARNSAPLRPRPRDGWTETRRGRRRNSPPLLRAPASKRGSRRRRTL